MGSRLPAARRDSEKPMRKKCSILALLFLSLLANGPAYALTAMDVLVLKKAGVGDDTIQMLLEADRDSRAVADRIGHYRTSDGWLVHTTPDSQSADISPANFYGTSPLCISPTIFPKAKSHWPKK